MEKLGNCHNLIPELFAGFSGGLAAGKKLGHVADRLSQ
jgi:hypothetical protein